MIERQLFPSLERKGIVELILATQLIVLLPLFEYLPHWVAIICVTVIGYRLLIKRLGKAMPGKVISALFGIVGGLLIYLEFGTFAGRDAGVSLIVLMFSLKLLEMRWYRDAALVLYLSFFIMTAHFLFSQSLLMALYMLFCLLVVITTLQALNRTNVVVELPKLVKSSVKMLLLALPLMLILFVFFPRLSEPLWRMPSGQSGTTGIDDSMTPGDIGSLVTFTEPAFRVKFNGDIPSSSELYWRGLVFSEFDGLTWSRQDRIFNQIQESDVQLSGPIYDYEILLEPHRRNWLYALEMPESMSAVAKLTSDYTWERRFRLTNKLSYKLKSHTRSLFGSELSPQERVLNTSLPDDVNPQSKAWAEQLRQNTSSDLELIQTVLRQINQQPYWYTLEPGVMERDTVDDFWFNKQRGFCEHYAGAFVFMMRAAGIPARVVTGYQGGEMNPYGDYMIVRQSNAHAWTEVWLQGRGWVRYDPTAAIHPSRVEVDLSQSWLQREALFDDKAPSDWSSFSPSLFSKAQLYWDNLNSYWQSEVIDFGAESQFKILDRLGLSNMSLKDLAYLLIVITSIFMLLSAGLFMRKRISEDPVARAYSRLNKKLKKLKLEKKQQEGPIEHLQRISQTQPELATKIKPAILIYVQLRYMGANKKQRDLIKQFEHRVASF